MSKEGSVKKKKMPVLIPFLVFVSLLFIGILIFAYVETKKANPQMIEVGQGAAGAWALHALAEREAYPLDLHAVRA